MKYTFLTQTVFYAKYLLCLRTLKILISKNYKFVNKNSKKKYLNIVILIVVILQKKKTNGPKLYPCQKKQAIWYNLQMYFNMSLKCAFEDILGGMYLCTVGGCLTDT